MSEFMGEEPSGRFYNEIALDYNGQPHNPMINSGAILSAAMLLYLVRPEMSNSEKFEFVQNFFSRMAGGLPVGFQNTVGPQEGDHGGDDTFLSGLPFIKGVFRQKSCPRLYHERGRLFPQVRGYL